MRKSFASIYKTCPKHLPFKDISAPELKLTTVSVDFEGRSLQQSKYVVDDPRERYSGLVPSDFSLENQLAVGVSQKLAQFSPSLSSIDSEITRVNHLTKEDFNNEK